MRVSGTRANGPHGAIANAAAQTGLNTTTDQAILLNPLIRAMPHTPMSQSRAIDNTNIMWDDGEGFDYDADDESEGGIEEKKQGGREVEGFNTEMGSDMDDIDDDGSAVDGYEGWNENDANNYTDKEQLRCWVTQRSQSQGITNCNNSRDGNTDKRSNIKINGGQDI